MKNVWNVIQVMFSFMGGVMSWFFGPMNGMMYTLVAFVVCDYITGVLCAGADKKLSSEVGFKGIAKKVFIFVLVGIGHLADKYIIGMGETTRTAIIFFYLSNEGMSIIENAAHLGVPFPDKIKTVLSQISDKHSESSKNSENKETSQTNGNTKNKEEQ